MLQHRYKQVKIKTVLVNYAVFSPPRLGGMREFNDVFTRSPCDSNLFSSFRCRSFCFSTSFERRVYVKFLPYLG